MVGTAQYVNERKSGVLDQDGWKEAKEDSVVDKVPIVNSMNK